MIDIGVCQQDSGNRCRAQLIRLRLKRQELLDLRGQIRRGIYQPPRQTVSCDRDAGLALWRYLAPAREQTVTATTIPLRQAATSGAAQHANANSASSASLHRAGVARALEKDRHVSDCRLRPTLFRFLHSGCTSHLVDVPAV